MNLHGALFFFLLTTLAHAQISLIAKHEIPGTAKDKSKTQDQVGGLGSGISWTGDGDKYVLIADRGPNDGQTDYLTRFHTLEIKAAVGDKPKLTTTFLATTLLTNEANDPLHGALTFLNLKRPEKSLRFDPEAIRVSNDSTYFISDEYGPYVFEFDAKGKKVRALAVPEKFLPKKLSTDPKKEMPPHNEHGRQPNRGMEGLAISPDGSKLYALLQSPLIQDGGLDAKNERIGLNCRILEIDVKTEATREYVYPLEDAHFGVNEILAVNDHQFLVIERDGKPGQDSKGKALFLIDTNGATDVSSVAKLPSGRLPKSIQPVKKSLFLNLLAPKFALQQTIPEKIEGIAFGPPLPDGRLLLLVTSDNDFIPENPTVIYAFAVDAKELPGFKPQTFGK